MKLSKEKIKKIKKVNQILLKDVNGGGASYDVETFFRYAKDFNILFEEFTDKEIDFFINRLNL